MSNTIVSSIRVWDAPTRLFHWSTLAGLVLFRVVWGVVGTRYARFGEFVRGPGAAIGYARGLFGRGGERTIGHNPLGAFAVIAMLLLGAGMGVTGWLMAANGMEGDIKEIHEFLANAFLALAILHVIGVVASSWRHRENLPRPWSQVQSHGRCMPAFQATPTSWP